VQVSEDRQTLPIGVQEIVLLGHPVAHSRSPAMHNAAFADLDLPYVYRALDVLPDDVAATMDALEHADVVGGNVTVPHKLAAAALCDRLTDEATLIGAVNTFWWVGGAGERVLVGDNTDALGLERALREDLGLAAEGRALASEAVLLVGTGGAARAAIVALDRLGARVCVAGRDPGRSAAIADLVSADVDMVDLTAASALAVCSHEASIVVNATSLGLRGESLPSPLMELKVGQTAYDLVYGSATPFLLAATDAGASTHDGAGMLLHQAAEAFERWTGRSAPVERMRAALGSTSS
jgi:shikimate dehydrogenase